jgi:hypothetical protein
MGLYEVAKERREELVREAELNRLAKRLRAARKRRAGMSCASVLMRELERDARRLLELLRSPKMLMLALGGWLALWRKP